MERARILVARLPAFAALGVLVVAASLLFFCRLGCPLLEPEEARYAEIPRQMLEGGSWLVPTLRGTPYLHKPPLLYWSVMAAYLTLGVHDWSARLVPCTAAFLTVLVTFWWGKKTLGLRAGFLGALMLCLSARFIYLGRMLTMDSLLGLWVIVSLATAHLAIKHEKFHPGWWFVSALACGLGILTKGPVALVLVAIPVLLFQRLGRNEFWSRCLLLLSYVLVAIGIVCPWYVTIALRQPGFLSEFTWTHHLLRYVAPLDHREPICFYLPSLFLGMLPWTLLLPGLFLTMIHARSTSGLRFFLLASLWCLLFFSLSGCKRVGYIVPAFPPLALALGAYLDSVLAQEIHWKTAKQTRLAYWATLMVLIVGLGGNWLAVFAGLQNPIWATSLSLAAALAGWHVLRHGVEREVAPSWSLCAAVTFTFLFAGIHQVLPNYARKFSLRSQVLRQAALVEQRHVPIVCYPHVWDSVSFYLRRNDVCSYPPNRLQEWILDLSKRPETLVFIKTDDSMRELLENLPHSLEFVARRQEGRMLVGLMRRRVEFSDVVRPGSTYGRP